jgi:hypothetical protein
MTAQCEMIKKNGKRCGGRAMRGAKMCGPHATRPIREDRIYGPSPETGRWYFETVEERDAWLAERQRGYR